MKMQDLIEERGMTLISVLWIITILTVLASEFIYSMQLEVRIAKNWRDQVNAYYAAKAGLENAILVLKEDEVAVVEIVYDALDEDWAQELTGELNQSNYTTVITDESAKININTIDEETLTKAIVYSMGSADDMMEEEINAEAQALAAAIIEKRPYRTTSEMAKATDMTPELLYGKSLETLDGAEEEEDAESTPLVDITTIYSAERNITSDGAQRANINSGDANQIQQRINTEEQQIISQQEAQAIVDYGSEQGNNQQGGQPGQPGGGGQQPDPGGQPGQPGGEQANQTGYTSISQLLEVPAISQQTFDSISGSISVDSGDNNDMININTADASELENLDGIDNGIAEKIVNYRNQNQFGSVDDIRNVMILSIEDMKTIVDRVSISDDDILEGKVNINTAPLEILTMLPGMDEEKAQAIVDRRTVADGQTPTTTATGQATGPFTSVGQLMDIEGIDENIFRGLIDHVSCRSTVFEIKSEGRSLDGKIVQICTTVVDRSGDRVKTKYWKQE